MLGHTYRMALIDLLNIGMSLQTTKFVAGTTTAQKALGNLKTALSTTQAAFGALAGVLGAAVSVYALKSLTQESMGAIDSTAKLADRLGTSTEALIGLQHAADLSGTSSESLQSALEKMSVNLGKAQGGATGAREAFEQLGLNVDELAAGDPVEAVRQIADGINELPTSSERATAAMEIFGKQGVGLLNTLASGSEGISAMQAEADKLGLTFSRVDAAQVELANDAISRAGKLVTSLGQQLAIQLAPYIEAAATKLTEMATSGLNMGEVISTAIEWVVSGIGLVADVIHTAKLGFMALGTLFTNIAAVILEGVTKIAEGLEWLLNKIPGVNVRFTEGLRAMSDEMNNFAESKNQELWDEFLEESPSTAINSFFADVKASAQEAAEAIANAGTKTQDMGEDFTEAASKVSDLEKSLKEQIATFGMSSREIDIYKLKQDGVSESVLANVQALSDQLTAMEEKKALEDDLIKQAEQVIESTKTPLEKYEQEITKLRTLLDKGLIDQTTFDRAAENAASGLDGKDKGDNKVQFAAAMELGSNEARSAILRNRFGTGPKDKMDKVEQNTKMLVDKEQESIGVLKQILAKTSTEEVFTF